MLVPSLHICKKKLLIFCNLLLLQLLKKSKEKITKKTHKNDGIFKQKVTSLPPNGHHNRKVAIKYYNL